MLWCGAWMIIFWIILLYISAPPVTCPLSTFLFSGSYFLFPSRINCVGCFFRSKFHHLTAYPLWQWDSSIAGALSLSTIQRVESLLQDDNDFLVFCWKIWYFGLITSSVFREVAALKSLLVTRETSTTASSGHIGLKRILPRCLDQSGLFDSQCPPVWGNISMSAFYREKIRPVLAGGTSRYYCW